MNKSAPLCVSAHNFSTISAKVAYHYYDRGRTDDKGTREIWLFACALSLIFGIIGNAFYFVALANNRLRTATFTYLRILALFHIVYCAVLAPLWLSSHLLPISFITLFVKLKLMPFLNQTNHTLLLSIAICLSSRLIKQIQYLRYLRPWRSYVFIAWRKLLWGIPICICLNSVLFFEYQITPCNSAEILSVNLTVFGRKEWFKLWLVRFVPIVEYWLLVIATLYHLFCFLRAFRRKTQSNWEWFDNITVIKHEHLLRNVQPMLIALVVCYGIVFIPKTICLWVRWIGANSLEELTLFACAYASVPFLTLLLSKAFRNECHVQIIESFCKRNDSNIDRVCGSLSEQNSEYVDAKKTLRSSIKGQRKQCPSHDQTRRVSGLKNALKIDGEQRVRFAAHPTGKIPQDGTSNDSNAEESA